jgi:outer membrane murein-binding lipoprotein Lpp
MTFRRKSIAAAALTVVAGLGLSGCATEDYVDQHIATVNMRIDGVEANVQQVSAAAAAAQASADQANSAAQGAAGSAQQANQRIDALSSRVDALEQHPQLKRPRN